ncbi:LOW QUALITY PROTEIN: putative epidermal cell surface receptor [Limulus polyphemus]|uniref:LOW QUALITY PROTEIN: putative epidermal cell surface receptor n=1 Tax=Limulus polyphemus TaxID=6850 RepID=A0ABM1SYX1_LIMPO|nr:LOW QUALITY PROTEIN: putative epidermal cell surface receptor [Limulus polyphemus]
MGFENKYRVMKKIKKEKQSTKSDWIDRGQQGISTETVMEMDKEPTEKNSHVSNVLLGIDETQSNDLLDEEKATRNQTVEMKMKNTTDENENDKELELEGTLSINPANNEGLTTQLTISGENDVTEKSDIVEHINGVDVIEETTVEEDNMKDAANISSRSEHFKDLKVPVRQDGCKFKNETYKTGEMFMDGCEASCTCEGGGRIMCVPRCSLVVTSGPNCRELPDPSDPCCRIMVCEPEGPSQNLPDLAGLLVKIESAEALNASFVRLRVVITPEKTNTEREHSDMMIQVWYAHTTESRQGPSDNKWMKQKFFLRDLLLVEPGVYDVNIHGLEPNSQYYIKVMKQPKGGLVDTVPAGPLFSNTVSVKTFPPQVQGVFQGCFHHNMNYDLGQVFYDGCELKCVCREEGRIYCQDRCEIYVDTVGFEECKWGPAPDDPCCTIPYCRDQIDELKKMTEPPALPTPPSHAMCTSEDGVHHQLGDTWELESGCKRRVCTCVLNSKGSTMVKCEGGCPPIPADALQPSPDCPQPVMINPDDPCLCPYIVCNNAVNTLSAPMPMCEFKGKSYHVGEEFYDNCRAVCHCGPDLQANCAIIECPHHFAPHVSECLEWDIDPVFVPKPPNCCPPPKCINDGSCMVNGVRFKNFQPIPDDKKDCGRRCVCVNGNVTCEDRCPPLGNIPPPNLPCPPTLAYKGQYPGDKCCMHWMCKEQERQAFCYHRDRRYRLGENWEVLKGSVRRQCLCREDNKGNSKVECVGGCQPIPEKFKQPNPQCPRPVLVTPDDPLICPYIVCNNTDSGKELQNVNVMAVNATTARIRFTLPSLLVGLVGHAELHFTTDPSTPESEWKVQKFARPNRLFDTSNIEYYMSGLHPETTYFFQIHIKIDALQNGPKSEIFKLVLPSLTTTTSTTTSTTLPPMIMLDARLTSESIDSNTVRVIWRDFEPQEKRFIDGIRLKYKLVNEGEDRWKTTPIIHRDVTSYIIRNLMPGVAYIVDIEFMTPGDILTHLVSTKPVEIKTIPKPKDIYNFEVKLDQGIVGPYSTDFVLQGVPIPISKYVHVVRVMYNSDTNSDQAQIFKVPKTNKISIENLEPGKRYKLWVDLYLTNGKTVSSDVIDFMTKAGAPKPPTTIKNGKEDVVKEAEALQGTSNDSNTKKAYYVALIIVAIVAAVAGLGFIVLLIILMKKQSSAKAPITRAPSESAYDNPTYKTYDGDNTEQKNGTVQP